MTGPWFKGIFPTRGKPAEIDTTVAHPARVYDYWLGGKDNFAADREAAERGLAISPGLRFRVNANREQPPRGRPGGRPLLAHRLRGQRPDRAGPRPRPAHQHPRGRDGLPRGRPPRT